jgi:hypothetical protein
MTVFMQGDTVEYRGDTGRVNYVDPNTGYVTICVREFEDRAKNVCVVVYPYDLHEIIPLEKK